MHTHRCKLEAYLSSTDYTIDFFFWKNILMMLYFVKNIFMMLCFFPESEFLPMSRDGAAQPVLPEHSDTTATSKRPILARQQMTNKNATSLQKVLSFNSFIGMLAPSHLLKFGVTVYLFAESQTF